MSKRISKIAAQVPATEQEVEALISRTKTDQLAREKLIASRDTARLAALDNIEKEHHFDRDLAALDVSQARNMEILETWAAINKKSRFGKLKSVVVAGVRIGWRLGNWKTALLPKTKWADVLEFLQTMVEKGREEDAGEKAKARAELAHEYIRVRTDADKESMLRDRDSRAARALLKKAGVVFEQDETFYFEPDRDGQAGPVLTTP